MTRELTYGKSRALGILMMTVYVLGLLPISYSKSCTDASQPLRPVLTETELISADSATACIIWLRTMHYVQAWSERYKYKRLVIIGAHTSQLPFEKNIDNMHWAIHDLRITFPFVISNNYSHRNSFNSQYWQTF